MALAISKRVNGTSIFDWILLQTCSNPRVKPSYANMDYIFLASIIGIAILTLIASYDIGCQWSVHFFSRVASMPDYLQLSPTLINIYFVVPAFHLEAHIDKCKPLFSPRYLRGLAQTEFEAIKRIWAILKGAAASLKEMRPGHRRDTLDDFCGYANWTKTTRLGKYFYFLLYHRSDFSYPLRRKSLEEDGGCDTFLHHTPSCPRRIRGEHPEGVT